MGKVMTIGHSSNLPENMVCRECLLEKKRKEFQRDSKIYLSCNECSARVEKLINDGFKFAFEFFNKEFC